MMAYVDSSIWISRFEGHYSYQNIVENQLREIKKRGFTLCVSEAVLLEVLFKPYRNDQQSLIDLYHRVFSQLDILPNYDGVFRDALTIATKDNLRGIDSIHVALATHYGCERFITTDSDFRNLSTIYSLVIDLTPLS